MSEVEAVVEDKPGGFQAIWLLPVAVVVIGAWVIAQSYLTQGPTINVIFETAEGIQAGKTRVKAHSVEVGTVDEVKLADDRSSVIVTVQLDSGSADLLREDTQFWVVRPRIGTGGVSGLGTLLSGAYIELYPGMGVMGKRDFVGLENVPATPPGVPGVRITLYSDRANSVGAGDPVLYRGFQVGRVESAEIDEFSRIHIGVFIEAPHDQYVKRGARFWNASGLTIEGDASGIRVVVDSLTALLAGGIAFDVPAFAEAGQPVADGAAFRLFRDKRSSETDPYEFGRLYVLRFEQSLRGLRPGAPVEYRGIRVGTVQHIMIDVLGRFERGDGTRVPVLIRVEPGRFGVGDSEEGIRQLEDGLDASVSNGLRATIQTGNLLTGSLYISFDHYPDEPAATVGEFDGHPELPTLPGGLQRIERQISTLLAKINDLPLDRTVTELNDTLTRAKSLLASVDQIADSEEMQAMPARINATLEELEAAVASFSQGSEFYDHTNVVLVELTQTLQSLRAVTRTLEEAPNSLVFSATHEPDPEPKAVLR
ncbi:MAG: intermembrane transport protein PqiB [Gammaproteobacteria bacterium]|nr:intermembrane transport protein PqiB [Gammaproteobacteria bacterium]